MGLACKALTKAALAVKASKGERTGAVPFGCRLADDGIHLEADPDETAIVAAVAELRAAGLSIRGIAAVLAERGHKTRKGGAILPTQVARILGRGDVP